MPFEIPNAELCTRCPHGLCVSYIREQSRKMKDRDTQYRLAQNIAMACCFDEWIPGGPGCPAPTRPFKFYLEQLVGNAKNAGRKLESLNHFGVAEEHFSLTPAQVAKVTGDTFEVFCRALLWNCCAESNRAFQSKSAKAKLPFAAAIVTLGDNYNLRNLLTDDWKHRLDKYLNKLADQGVELSYSTPDVIGVNITALEPETQALFSDPISNLSLPQQGRLNASRKHIEGRMRPQDVVFACGLKTSLRSDRMYQFLFEANAWKFIWRHVFGIAPCPYYTVVSRIFGANPKKLNAIDFSSPPETVPAPRVIDSVEIVENPDDIKSWFDVFAAQLRLRSL